MNYNYAISWWFKNEGLCALHTSPQLSLYAPGWTWHRSSSGHGSWGHDRRGHSRGRPSPSPPPQQGTPPWPPPWPSSWPSALRTISRTLPCTTSLQSTLKKIQIKLSQVKSSWIFSEFLCYCVRDWVGIFVCQSQ